MLAARAGPSAWDLVFVSDGQAAEVLGIPQLSPDFLGDHDEVVIAVGDSRTRKAISERLRVPAGVLKAPTAIVGPDVEWGEGAVFCDFSMVTASARIGRHFQCNIYSYVAHDCIIGDYVTFAPKVSCNGNVHIGDGAYIGTGAVLKQGTPSEPLIIGEGAVVGMGAVVTKSVPAGAVVVGNPAKPLPER
jgi:sugar O-acyltransferase (sialic acid O-acetyltransferase NeuD family)